METDVRQRMQLALREKQATINSFAVKHEQNQSKMNKQINGDTTISVNTILLLLDDYPDISAEWLLRGVGEMLIMDAEKHVNDTPTTRKRHDNEPERLPDNSGEIDALRETIATQRITIQSLLEQIDLLKKGDSSAQLHSARVG